MSTRENKAKTSWEEEIASYLKDNPDFFIRHSKLLSRISVPHTDSGEAVSLIERQVEILRDQSRHIERKLRELISNARENELLSSRLHGFAKTLLLAEDLDALLDQAIIQIQEVFHLDAVVVRIVSEDGGSIPAYANGAKALADEFDTLRLLVASREPVCGDFLNEDQKRFLFGSAHQQIRSSALIGLETDNMKGVFCLGSQDPNRFTRDMATDYLARLGELLGSAITRQLHV